MGLLTNKSYASQSKMADTPQAFAVALLHRLGIKPNSNNVRALVGWQKAEGGHWHNDAKYNPLNTTQSAPGAGNTGSQGNIKVYRSWHQGVEATAKTLENGRYGSILHALRGGSANDVASAIGSTPWGTNAASVMRTIGGTGKVSTNDTLSGGGSTNSSVLPSGSRAVSASTDVDAQRRVLLAQYLQRTNPNSLLLRTGALDPNEPTVVPNSPPATGAGASNTKGAGTIENLKVDGGKSPLFELIHNDGKTGYAVKNGQIVSGPGTYGAVWEGHKDHVHVAAGKKTIVALGRLAQAMGLHVGENSHFGGVSPVHVAGSYHYKDEAIDVSGDPKKMNEYARRVEHTYGLA